MNMLWRSLAVLSVLALALAPLSSVGAQNGGAAGETSTVKFFGHIFGHGMAAPMPSNTEAPIGESNYGLGFISSCTPAGVVYPTCETHTGKRLVLFSTPGFVDVETRAQWQQEGSYSLLHNERGQTKDIMLDTSQSIEATLYMSVDFHGWPVGTVNDQGTNCAYPHPPDVPCLYPYWGWDVGVQPGSTVWAKLYSAKLGDHGGNASDAPPVQDAIESGDATLVAEGQWGPDQVVTGVPGYSNAHEFTIDLGPPQVDTIPREDDFFMVFGWNQEASGVQYGTHTWRLWAGEFFPPSYTLPVENAFDVERVIPNFAHGKLAILGVMNTPWGSYDIHPDSVDLEIEGPQGTVTPEMMNRFGSFSVAHGGHYLPINITWIWDYQREGLQPGEYSITVSAQNFQGSASGTCTATFTLESAPGNRLRPGNVEEGVCGLQSASEEFLDTIKDGSTNEGGS